MLILFNTFIAILTSHLGLLGQPLVEAFASLSPQPAILVLGRASLTQKSFPEEAKTAIVDYNDADAIAAVLREHKVEGIILTIDSIRGVKAQFSVADAAKKAGVKVFAPSEFGIATNGLTEDPLVSKQQIVCALVNWSCIAINLSQSISRKSSRLQCGFLSVALRKVEYHQQRQNPRFVHCYPRCRR
jgi:hypothetical protein